MILIFLGSWRSTLIIAVSIPLSIICSLLMLAALGETINIMTLGGLALAVGILVDDATVEIENINRNLEEGKEVEDAILTGAAQIAVPAFVSTLSICIVFVPMFFLGGVARYLFVPLAEAVVFAMLASYFLSRTIVPTMAKYLLKGHEHDRVDQAKASRNPFVRFQITFEHYFEKLRNWYYGVLGFCMEYRAVFLVAIVAFWVGSIALLYPWLGQDFFPSVDGGQFKLHVRAHTGTRIEDTARLCDQIEDVIRREIPQAEMGTVIDNIGVPYSGLNLSYSNSATVGTADADILVTLAEKHRPTAEYTHTLRDKLTQQFPGTEFYYLPTDMVSQILNFGLPAQIDVQVVGNAIDQNHDLAEHMMQQISHIPGTTDLRIQQPFNLPNWTSQCRPHPSTAGRLQSARRGQRCAHQSERQLPDLADLLSQSAESRQLQHRSADAAVRRPEPAAASELPDRHQRLQPAAANTRQYRVDRSRHRAGNRQSLQRAVGHRHLRFGRRHRSRRPLPRGVDKIVKDNTSKLPRGSEIFVRGQIQTMHTSFVGLVSGLLFSIILVYALIVVNFQSWLDPFIIIAALPGALAGIVWLLFLTGTHISVPALTGAIMCVGVATANSILVVSFAKEQMEAGLNCCRMPRSPRASRASARSS